MTKIHKHHRQSIEDRLGFMPTGCDGCRLEWMCTRYLKSSDELPCELPDEEVTIEHRVTSNNPHARFLPKGKSILLNKRRWVDYE